MSKCEFINKVKATEYGSEELIEAIVELEQECKKCTPETCKCEPEEVEEIEDLVDQLEEEGFIEYIDEECTCDDCKCSCEDEEDEVSDIEKLTDMIALDEEIKRIEKQDSVLDIPEAVKQSDTFKTAMKEAYAVAGAFKVLMKAGIDYSNAVAVASNIITSYQNKEIAKVQQVVGMANQV